MCADKNGISAREVERKYGVCPRSAWHLLHRIRAAMANGGPLTTMTDTIVADETFIGGKPKNRHQQGRPRHLPEGGKGIAGSAGVSSGRKVAAFTLIDKERGEAPSRVVPNVQGHTLRKAIAEQVNMAGSVLYTDSACQRHDPLAGEGLGESHPEAPRCCRPSG